MNDVSSKPAMPGSGLEAAGGSLECGVVGNCAFSAMIDRMGSVVWSCLPRFDGDPVFNALLDPSENGSLWRFEIDGYSHGEQAYEPNTAVLRTRLFDRAGNGIEITDFAPRFLSRDRMFRPLMLVRRVRPIGSGVRMRVLLRPRFEYGVKPPQITQGSHHIRYVGPAQTLRLNTDASLSHVLAETFFVLDRPMNFMLGPDETLAEGIEDTAHRFEKETIGYWRTWSRRPNGRTW
jgi:GH15 family glucan-1,4-alpha-glucosidase